MILIYCIFFHHIADSIDISATSLTIIVDDPAVPLRERQSLAFSTEFDITLTGAQTLPLSLWPHLDVMFIVSADQVYDEFDLTAPYLPEGCIRQQLSSAYTDPSTTVNLQDFGEFV